MPAKRWKMQWLFKEKRIWKTLHRIWNTLHRPSSIVEKQMGHEPIFVFPLQVTLRTPPNTAKADLGFGVGSCPTLKAAVLRAER